LKEILWEISWQNILMYSISVDNESDGKKQVTFEELENII